jgi:hypothetical protein
MGFQYRRKGAILLQTLVVSVLLSMIAVTVMRWVMSRYLIANRAVRTSVSVSSSQGYAGLSMEKIKSITNWDMSAASGQMDLNNKKVQYSVSSSGDPRFSKMQVTVPDDY